VKIVLGVDMVLIPHRDEDAPHKMIAKRDGECAECEQELVEGDEIIWDPKEYKAYCIPCGEELL
jgi:hypothetical protein